MNSPEIQMLGHHVQYTKRISKHSPLIHYLVAIVKASVLTVQKMTKICNIDMLLQKHQQLIHSVVCDKKILDIPPC